MAQFPLLSTEDVRVRLTRRFTDLAAQHLEVGDVTLLGRKIAIATIHNRDNHQSIRLFIDRRSGEFLTGAVAEAKVPEPSPRPARVSSWTDTTQTDGFVQGEP